jgi:DNA-binding NtrC family response regulator
VAAHAAECYQVFVGQSPRIRQLSRQILRLSRTRWPVLILGETGTGKEVAARAIHASGGQGPFVPIDCSALVGPLMESELFGHAKGSFTGAILQKTGLIEAANGGTAFLDEIGELPLDMQVKLLRVLQEKEFRPVGSLTAKRSDFRVIAATNRDLAREVAEGRFRRDLYYRLNVVTVRLPPLRERKEDIPLLIDHFLSRHGATSRLTQETLEVMMSYEWPGNVRELENCVHRLLAIDPGPLVEMHDLPSAVQNHGRQRAYEHGQGERREEAGARKGPREAEEVIPLAEVERRAILHALRVTKGDRATAAQLLGIGRTTLYRKLKEYLLEDVEEAAS